MRLIEDVPLTIYPYVNTVALFRGQWGFRKGDRSKGDYQHYLEEVQPIFVLKQSMADEGILHPQLVYGWYPVTGDGDDLVVFDPEDHGTEIERFSFLAISDAICASATLPKR